MYSCRFKPAHLALTCTSLVQNKRSAFKEDVLFWIQFGKLREYGQDDAYTRVYAHTVW